MTNDMKIEGALVRRLATILCADVAGYSQMMGVNEERTVQVFRGHREIFESLVRLHRGRIFNTAGDALLAEFESAVEAVRCATEIQAAMATRNEQLEPGAKMLFRIGLNLGDVIVQGDDLLGDGVNVAARIQATAEPGGICISGAVYDQIQNKLSLEFRPLGEQTYKNIARPVRTYTIGDGAVVTHPLRRATPAVKLATGAALIALAGAAYWGYRQYDARRAEQESTAAQLVLQKQLAEKAQRAAEDAQREAQAQAQKSLAEDALRRAQEERDRVERDRKALESERRAAEAARKQAEATQRAAPQAASPATAAALPTAAPSATAATPGVAAYDGTYAGRLCNHIQDDAKRRCWSTMLVVRNGTAEGNWVSRSQNISKLTGTISANGVAEFRLAAWTRDAKPIGGLMIGRVADDAMTATGKWDDGAPLAGDWKRSR